MRLTDEQRAAVHHEGGPLLVSAAAGSGKTSVLVQRLLRHLETDDGKRPHIDQFVVITYTRAAAAELRFRIRKGILDSIRRHPEDRHLARQVNRLHRARIETIHAFCAGILRENAALSGLPAGFRLADAQETALLRKECMETALEELYEHHGPDTPFGKLAEALSDMRGDRRLSALLLEIDEKMQGRPNPLEWLAQTLANDAVFWEEKLLARMRREAEDTRRVLEAAHELLADTPELAGAYGPAFRDDLTHWQSFLGSLAQGWEAASCYAAAWPPPTRLGSTRAAPEQREFLRALRDRAKKRKEKMISRLVSGHEENRRALADAAPLAVGLIDALRVFREVFGEAKKRRSMADFSDLEHKTYALLWEADSGKITETARSLGGRYREILVDEYQDVNEVQERILQALSLKGNLFMVGDARQSIYRFRMADPGIFMDKYERYPDAHEANPGQGRKLLLSRNFRSKESILTAVNDVFAAIMSREAGEMAYTQREYLVAGLLSDENDPQPGIELLITDRAEDADEGSRLAAEANQLAAKIRELLDEGVPPGDITILLRSPSAGEAVFKRAMEQRGIPCASGESIRFFETPEITAALSYLAVLDNPRQDVPLLAVMRAPGYDFTADELAALRLQNPDASLWEALEAAAEAGHPKASFLCDHIHHLRMLAPDLRVDRLLWRMYRLTGWPQRYAALPGGETRREHLLTLSEMALEAEKTSYQGLYGFLAMMEKRREQGYQPETAAAGTDGAVRIMSIHKSKGLEFPVVILADSVRRFNRVDVNKSILFHASLGVGCLWHDEERHVYGTTVCREAIREQLEDELAAEEMRMLYVALTRAQKRLIVSAVLSDAQKKLTAMQQRLLNGKITPCTAREASCHAEWLLMTALALSGDGELPAHWRMHIVPPAAAVQEAAKEPPGHVPAEPAPVPQRYPYAKAVDLPSKITATGLKGRFQDEEAAREAQRPSWEPLFDQPRFISGQRGLSPAEKGTAMHLAMQYADFSAAGADAAQELGRLRQKGLLTQAQADAVRPWMLERFFKGALGQRLLRSPQVLRECKFSLLTDASQWETQAQGESMLLQGVIDCAFWEEEGWVIVDFKTDYVASGAEHERAQAYAGQLRAYEQALTRMTGKPVKQAILYFFETDKAISLKCGLAI